MVAQPVATVSNSRAARKAAYDRALRRAIAANVEIYSLPNGAYCVQSATRPDAAYIVDANYSCQCAAAQNGNPFCLHSALALAMDGVIAWPDFAADGEAAAETADAPRTVCEITGEAIDADGFYSSTCRECSGLGYGYAEWGRDAYTVTCAACGGTGRKIAA